MNAPNWHRVKHVFQLALRQRNDERAAYVREQCGDDEALRTEVDAMLAAHARVGSFAEQPAVELLNALPSELTSGNVAPHRTLSAGEHVGVYEIQAFVGAGGMGEVYKARDTRLERVVAIKVLAGHLAADLAPFQRLEREARAVASLDHPQIGALYDIGQESGRPFLVMQFLDGETLAARLAKGPLPVDQALRYAVEIADALAHAHRHGIVHRDIKPGNIFLTAAGARLIDFGLAKHRTGVAAGFAATTADAATVPDSLTGKGVIVGTLHYMAPEQVEGKETDARTDVFAFGVVLYEMLTGRRAFSGDNSASVIAAILESQPPPLATLRPLTAPALDHVLRTCLAKSPDERWESAADLSRSLRWIADFGVEPGRNPAGITPKKRARALLVLTTVGLIAGASIATVAWRRGYGRESSPPARVLRSILPVKGALVHDLALSPDGTRLAYISDRNGKLDLYLQILSDLDAVPVAGTDSPSAPFFSPDGAWIGFHDRHLLMKVAVSGGPPQAICQAASLYGASWGADGTIVFSPNSRSGLYRVSASGGTPEIVTQLETGEKSHRFPQILPGNKAALFMVETPSMSSFDEARIAIVSLDTRQRRTLLQGGANPRFVPSGHLLYFHGASLIAAPFDAVGLKMIGPPATVLEGISVMPEGVATFGVADTGLVAYVRGDVSTENGRVAWVDRQGGITHLAADRVSGLDPRLSPDGQRLALMVNGPNDQIWIYDINRSTYSRLTTESNNGSPGWSPDGQRLMFGSDRGGVRNLYWQPADGSGAVERLTESSHDQVPGSWSADGKVQVFVEAGAEGTFEIWSLSMADRAARPLVRNAFSNWYPRISPNGHWLAYVSDETGQAEVYVQSYPGLEARWQISNAGGVQPMWEPKNGRELYYQNGSKMMAVAIQTSPRFAAAAPHVLFEGPYEEGFDVARDGRFIMIERNAEIRPTQITLVQNWFEELKRRAPTHR